MFLLNRPIVRQLEIFSAMPGKYRKKNRTTWADANQGGRELDSFLEGPVFDEAGNLYLTDIAYGRVFCVNPNGQWDLVAQWDGEPNGMKYIAGKKLLITDYKNGLVLLDIASGQVKPYFSRKNTESFKGVNDLAISARGDIYFTDQGQTGLHDPSGRVYRLDSDGRLNQLLSNVPSPNGVVLSPDEKFLFVAATRANCVWRMPVQIDGSVSKAGQFFTSYGPSGPDGLAMDQQGRLLIANPGLAYIWVLNQRAEPVEILRGPAGHSLTNLAFGGKDKKTLFVTDSTSGNILYLQMDVAGVSLHTANLRPDLL